MNFFSRCLLVLILSTNIAPGLQAFEIELRGVEFQTSEPARASTLEKSVKLPSAQSLAVLRETIDTLHHYPTLKVKVIGFTDNKECVTSIACKELSLRRATLVYRWLLAQGILASRIVDMEARASEQPIDSNDLASGRQRNRRVEIIPIVDLGTSPHAS